MTDEHTIRVYWRDGALVLQPLTDRARETLLTLETACRVFECVEPEEDTVRLMDANRSYARRP